jgi:hypothetical protein
LFIPLWIQKIAGDINQAAIFEDFLKKLLKNIYSLESFNTQIQEKLADPAVSAVHQQSIAMEEKRQKLTSQIDELINEKAGLEWKLETPDNQKRKITSVYQELYAKKILEIEKVGIKFRLEAIKKEEYRFKLELESLRKSVEALKKHPCWINYANIKNEIEDIEMKEELVKRKNLIKLCLENEWILAGGLVFTLTEKGAAKYLELRGFCKSRRTCSKSHGSY